MGNNLTHVDFDTCHYLGMMSSGIFVSPDDWRKVVRHLYKEGSNAKQLTEYEWTWESQIGKVTLQWVPAIHMLFAYQRKMLVLSTSECLGPLKALLD